MSGPRPLQNRVDAFGELVASPARGMLLGNRGGKFHRDDRTLGRRRWASKQWIACVCAFKGRRREVWGAGYTQLFFLDEVTALAAGHRPCFECRRAEAEAFQTFFSGGDRLRAPQMDAILHAERLEHGGKRVGEAPFAQLPDGAMVAMAGCAYAIRGEALLPWSIAGYGAARARPRRGMARVLTPSSIVRALEAGYRPRWAALAS
jgi:hypothetical protein